MNKHTPGPWEETDTEDYIDIDSGCERICSVYVSDSFGSEYSPEEIANKKANAKLISAAPELLEALQCLMSRVAKDAESYAQEGNEPIWAFIEDANDAICKAKGEGN